MSRQGALDDESGFTLVELTIVIILMGVVFAVASSTWFGAIESRKVDSATNQLAADLRQAHTRATNRLADQTVTLSTESSEYTITIRSEDTDDDLDDAPDEEVVTDDLDDCDDEDVAAGDCADEDVVVVNTDASVLFSADGSAVVTGANPIRVESSKDDTKYHEIHINTTTSRIEIDPIDP